MKQSLMLVAVCCMAGSAVSQTYPEQQVHRRDFVPVSEDVFEVVRQFYDYDAVLPLDPRVVESWEEGSTLFEKIVYTTSTGERVPADLAIPIGFEGPKPCVLLVHGLGNSKERWDRDDRSGLRDSLLKGGVAVFAIDLQYHGERSAQNDYQNPVFLTFGDSLFVRSRNMGIQSTIDARRAIDYLMTRGDIDADRIGAVGVSMGGMIAVRLAALQPRLRAVVAAAVPTTLQPLPSDHFNFASRSRVTTLLLIGRDDWLSSPDDARTLLDLLPESSELTFYSAGHQMPPAFALDAARWLLAAL